MPRGKNSLLIEGPDRTCGHECVPASVYVTHQGAVNPVDMNGAKDGDGWRHVLLVFAPVAGDVDDQGHGGQASITSRSEPAASSRLLTASSMELMPFSMA